MSKRSYKPLTIYLAGPMQYAEDHGLNWREQAMKLLGSDFRCWSPNHFENETIQQAIEEGCFSEEVVRDLQKKNVWEVLKEYRITKDLHKHRQIMSIVIKEDLYRTVVADGLLCVWNGELTFGTPAEATIRFENPSTLPSILVTQVPMEKQSDWFLACFDKIFPTLKEACQHLKELISSVHDKMDTK